MGVTPPASHQKHMKHMYDGVRKVDFTRCKVGANVRPVKRSGVDTIKGEIRANGYLVVRFPFKFCFGLYAMPGVRACANVGGH